MSDLDDAAIWVGVCHDSPHAFGLIWDRHRDRVLRQVSKHGIDQGAAEDLTAVVFLELWRRRRQVTFVDGSLLPWLLKTSTYVSLNSARSRRRYRQLLQALPASDPALAADAHVQAKSDLAEVKRALATRGEIDSRLFELAVNGSATAEIAAELQITEAAAKMRLSRLRAYLRSSISD